LITSLFVGSTAAFLITCFGVIRRRRAIMVRFSGVWAAFTFPTISTTNAALLFWQWADSGGGDSNSNRNSSDSGGGHINADMNMVLYVWSATLCAVLLPAVLCVILAYTFCAVCRPAQLIVPAPVPDASADPKCLNAGDEEEGAEEEGAIRRSTVDVVVN
jgi:hypothetical protein